MKLSLLITAFVALMLANVSGFFVNNHLRRKNIVGRSLLSSSKTNTSLTMSAFDSSVEPGTCDAELLQQRQAAVASKFKIVTCTSTSCAKKRANLNLDEYATFGAFYERTSDSPVSVEESPCLGSCQKAPCVGIEHEDYEGTVALEGMTADEFSASCFHSIITEEDADRVWSSVENAIQMMAEAEESDNEE